MTTDEIKLLLAATEKRIAEIEPSKNELYSKYENLKREVVELSKPMDAVREEWGVLYTEFEALKVVQTLYVAELAKKGGATA